MTSLRGILVMMMITPSTGGWQVRGYPRLMSGDWSGIHMITSIIRTIDATTTTTAATVAAVTDSAIIWIIRVVINTA